MPEDASKRKRVLISPQPESEKKPRVVSIHVSTEESPVIDNPPQSEPPPEPEQDFEEFIEEEEVVESVYLLVDVPKQPAYLYQEQVMFVRNMDSDCPVLRIGAKELEGKYENLIGTGMLFEETLSEKTTEEEVDKSFGEIQGNDKTTSGSNVRESSFQPSGKFHFIGKTFKRLHFQ